MANTLDYVESWSDRLLSRLYTQFRDKVTWQLWCTAVLGPQFQDLEDAAQTLFSLLDIDASVGVQLDRIGRFIGQDRLGVSDTVYRLYLKARVLANKSTGTVEELFTIVRAIFGDSAGPRYEGGFVKQFALKITQVLTRTEALVMLDFLGDAKEAGARGILQWQEYEDSLMFEFATGTSTVSSTTVGGLIAGGSSSVTLVDGSSFPTTGGLIYISGSNNEYIRYTSRSGNVLTLISTVALGHSAGDTVELIQGTGLGFDDGYFAGALEA